MAIQTIGIKMLAQGVGRFVSDIAKASNATYNYASTVNRVQKMINRFNINEETKKFKTQSDAIKATISGLSGQLRTATSDLNKFKSSIKSVLSDMDSVRQKQSKIVKNIQDLQSKNAGSTAIIGNLKSSEKDIDRYIKKITSLRNEYARVATSMNLVTSGTNKYNSILRSLELQLAKLDVKIASTPADKTDVLQKFATQRAAIVNQMNLINQSIGANVISMAKFRTQLDAINKKITEYKIKLAEARKEVAVGDKAKQSIDDNNQKIQKLTQTYVDLNQEIQDLFANYNSLSASQANQTSIVQDLDNALTANKGALSDLTKQHDDFANQSDDTGGILSILSSLFSSLTGNFGANALASMGLEGALAKLSLKFTAVTLILDVVMIAFNLFGQLVKVVIGTIKLLWDVLVKIVDIAIKVGRAVLTWGVETFKKFVSAAANLAKSLIAIPFNLVKNGLSAIWESFKRIGEIAIGMNLSNLIWNIGTRIKDLGLRAVTAAGDFQLLTIRLRGLIQREQAETKDTPFSESLEYATQKAKDLSFWISEVAVKSIYKAEDIAKVYTLAMAYDMTSDEAQKLTMDVLNFATGMGLQDEAMVRIVENFGQMIAAGKMTGTELRDLSRGAFLPVNRILGIMGESLGLTQQQMNNLRANMKKLNSQEGVDLKGFFEAFSTMVGRDFPNAMENASVSWNVVISNITDFLDSVIGWRIITPILDVVSERMTSFMQGLMDAETVQAMANIGTGFGYIVDKVYDLVDAVTGFKVANITDIVKSIGNLFFNIEEMRSGDTTKYFKEVSKSISKIFGLSPEKASKITSNLYVLMKELDAIGKKPIAESLKNIWASLKPILDTAWDELKVGVQAGFTAAWAWVEDQASFIYDSYIRPFLEDLWNNYFKEWFGGVSFEDLLSGEKLGEALSGAINSAITWLSENVDIGESFGNTFFGGIITWISSNSGPTSALVSNIATAVGAALKLALATAINFALGGLGNLDTGNGGPGGERPASPLPAPASVQNQGGGLGKAQDPFTQALGAFDERVNATLTGSLDRLRQWVSDNVPLWNDLGVAIDKASVAIEFAGQVFASAYFGFKVFSDVLLVIAHTLSPISDLFGDIGRIFSGGEGGGGDSLGKKIDDFVKLSLTPLKEVLGYIEGTLKTIGAPFEFLANLLDRAKNDPMQNEPLGGAGLLQTIDWGRIWGGIVDAFNETAKTLNEDTNTATKEHKKIWEQLSTDLIGNSIITDMLTDIYNAITTKLGEINTYIAGTFVLGFKSPLETLKAEMLVIGGDIVQQLWDGIKGVWDSFLSWWETQKETFNVTVSVGLSTPGGETKSKTSTQTPAAIAAKGINMTVPPGYPNDDFLLGLTTGEKVIVIPRMQAMKMKAYNTQGVGKSTYWNTMSSYNSNYNVEKNYNWNVQSLSSYSDVRQAYDMMRLIDPEDL